MTEVTAVSPISPAASKAPVAAALAVVADIAADLLGGFHRPGDRAFSHVGHIRPNFGRALDRALDHLGGSLGDVPADFADAQDDAFGHAFDTGQKSGAHILGGADGAFDQIFAGIEGFIGHASRWPSGHRWRCSSPG